jgi:hypothetical protein
VEVGVVGFGFGRDSFSSGLVFVVRLLRRIAMMRQGVFVSAICVCSLVFF